MTQYLQLTRFPKKIRFYDAICSLIFIEIIDFLQNCKNKLYVEFVWIIQKYFSNNSCQDELFSCPYSSLFHFWHFPIFAYWMKCKFNFRLSKMMNEFVRASLFYSTILHKISQKLISRNAVKSNEFSFHLRIFRIEVERER